MISAFEANHVDGKMLLFDMDLDCLVEMGCSKLHSKKLLRLNLALISYISTT